MSTLTSLLEAARSLGLTPTAEQREQFGTYTRELLAWNEHLNLTAIRTEEEVELKHFVDSLTLFKICAFAGVASPKLETLPALTTPPASGSEGGANFEMVLPLTARVIDVGTGAGFPGLPLKIVVPTLHLTMVESVRKKATFLSHIVGVLGLQNVEVVTARAEDLGHDPQYRASYDLAVARAVTKLPALAELTLPFCRQGGFLVAYKGSGAQAETRSAERALSVLGAQLVGLAAVKPLPNLETRVLVVVRQVRRVPSRYPRRVGTPVKNPL